MEGTLDASGASFTIRNQSGRDIQFGYDYSIQIRINKVWYEIKAENWDYPLEMFEVKAGGDMVFDADWSAGYGELPKGYYRLVKEYETSSTGASAYVSCEFEIE